MKKILILTMLCLGFVAFSTKSFAQSSTPLKPYDGATHTYTFDGMVDGYNYQFYLTTDPQEKDHTVTVPATSGVLTGASGIVGDDLAGKASVSIKWDVAASGLYKITNPLYLFVKIWDETAMTNVCVNYKAVQIIPTSNIFNVIASDETGSAESCPELDFLKDFQPVISDVDVDGDLIPDPYNQGYSNVSFKVLRAGTTNAWDFNFTITNGTATNYTYTVTGDATGDLLVGAGDQANNVKDVAALAADNFVTITLKVPNVALVNPDFTFTINSASDNVTKAVDSNSIDDEVTHMIKILPAIGGFSGI